MEKHRPAQYRPVPGLPDFCLGYHHRAVTLEISATGYWLPCATVPRLTLGLLPITKPMRKGRPKIP
ncbi:MAG: hypothetical protein IPO07_21510 [Haliscomenobacter sp.]|nr:hypothetical protein [Haliscomenobacter sp.]